MQRKIIRAMALLLSTFMVLASMFACASSTPQATTAENTTVAAATEAATTAAATTAAATAAATTAAQATSGSGSTQAPSQYKQAPKLDGLDLPPVDERLPKNPLVVTPYESVGKYGGTWRNTIVIGLRGHSLAGFTSYEGRNLVIWDMERTEIVPNLVVDLPIISDDATTFTFTLREGIKWSDGTPLTTEHVQFWFEARESNLKINPGWQTAPIKVQDVIVHDEYTFSLVYNVPNPLALYDLSRHVGGNAFFLPKQYLAQFHPDYNDKAEDLAKEAGHDDWVRYFNDRNNFEINNELPTTMPYVLQNDGAGANTLSFERNPYFWAVDTEGNQLPYIDSVVVDIVESEDITMMRAAAGEIDMQMAVFTETYLYYPFLAENAAAGDFSIGSFDIIESGAINLHFNIAHDDPVIRAVYGDARFRKAMSHAMNRDLIINTQLTVGPVKATPRNFSPYPGSPWFDEKWSSAYTEYDLDKANALLDEMGLDQRNAAGIRLMSNGEPLGVVIDVPLYDKSFVDLGIAVADSIKVTGVDATARSLEPALWGERGAANEWEGSMMRGSGGFQFGSLNDINDYTGFRGTGWMTYYQNAFIRNRQSVGAREAVEPDDYPDEIVKLWDLGAEAAKEIDEAKRNELYKQMFDIHEENLYVLGIGTILPGIYIVSNRMGNVPPLHADWSFGHGGHGRPSQYYFK
ncbi:MAG: ABC transporter substrate-binding protein [Oscillospiraceae bacterium]|nr:ABC transporter substrate-binding protein [Oscillospiraceae bacterium]